MIKISQLFLGILSFLVVGILLFYTFFVQKDSSSDFLSSFDFSLGIFSVSSNNGVYSIEEGKKSSLLFERISTLNEIFFSKNSIYSQKNKGNIKEFILEKGDFTFYFYDIENLPKIQGPGFIITPQGVGKIFVHIGQKDNSIVSQDSIFRLELTDIQAKESYTEIFSFPHTFLTFDPLKNKYLKNADRIRIFSVCNLGYIDTSFGKDFSSAKEKFSSLGFEDKFIEEEIAYAEKRQADYHKKYEELTSLGRGFYFPGLQYIQKYSYLFFNKTKKLSYYQKLFEVNLQSIIQSKKTNLFLVQETYSYLQSIKAISENGYQDSLLLLRIYYKILLLSGENESFENKKMYFNLISRVYGFSSQEKKDIYKISLISSINKYDYEDISGFYKNILFFLEDYFNQFNNIFLQKEIKSISQEKIYLDYFSFYIESVLVSNFQLGESYIEDIIKILGKYVLMNDLTYGNGDEKRKITGMYITLNLLKNVQAYLRGMYFELERDKLSLLVMKKNDLSIYLKNSDELKKSIQTMKNFFVDNKSLLDENNEKDKLLIDEYEALMDLYEEYFLALEDYDKYALTYDEFKKQLLATKIYEKKETLSEESFISYISQFIGVDTKDAKINIIDSTYYEVKDIFVGGSNFSFRLYPLNDYEISNIVIDGNKKSFSYKLNLIKQDWEEKQKKISGKDKDKYSFKNFFTSTFSVQEAKKGEDFVKIISTPSEDKVIKVFKLTKLLGAKGEFNSLSSFLTIPYNTLFVVEKNGKYDITLSGSTLNVSKDIFGTSEDLFAQFSSSYIMTEKDHYFSEIQLKIYKPKDGDNFLLGGNTLNIVGNIDIPLFVKKISLPFGDFKDINFIFESLAMNLGIKKIDIKYYLSSARTIIKFDFQGNITNIFLARGQVSAIMFGTKNILSQTINVREIDQYLNKLKK